MSADQLIAELKALPPIERQQVINAALSEEVIAGLPETPTSAESADFIDRWKGKFSLPERDPEDARLTYLLDRFSS